MEDIDDDGWDPTCTDPYDPRGYPWKVHPDSVLGEASIRWGFEAQWRVQAGHLAGGGPVNTLPWLDLSAFETRYLRGVLEGAQQARDECRTRVQVGLYDAAAVLEEISRVDEERKAEEAAADAAIPVGEFTLPDDLRQAELYTRVPRLFTDTHVEDPQGFPFHPKVVGGELVTLRGRLHVVGHGELDLGIDLDGEYLVDLVDADVRAPGTGIPVMRLVWRPSAAPVGAVRVGKVTGWRHSWVGFGPQGASSIPRTRFDDLPYPQQLSVIETDHGTSVWCYSGSSISWFDLFLLVDADYQALGMVLDGSGVEEIWEDDDEA